MVLSIKNCTALVFDCDGVILDSNRIKSRAFYQAALPYGEHAAQVLLDYHVLNGGISRYKKFAHFLANIVHGQTGPDLETLLDSYANYVRDGLLYCECEPHLKELREQTAAARWLVVSGGDQNELREIFAGRELDHLFDGGIYGSPDSKEEILARECASGNIGKNSLFIGDSRYDHHAAIGAGLEFIFMSQWTEFEAWPEYCQQNNLNTVSSLAELCP